MSQENKKPVRIEVTNVPNHINDWYIKKQANMTLEGKRISLNSIRNAALEHYMNAKGKPEQSQDKIKAIKENIDKYCTERCEKPVGTPCPNACTLLKCDDLIATILATNCNGREKKNES